MKNRQRLERILVALVLPCFVAACGQTEVGADKGTSTVAAQVLTVEVAAVKEKQLDKASKLPGELVAYRNVGLYPKVAGFVKSLSVDRGSIVKQGQLIVRLEAPEMVAQKNQAGQNAGAAETGELEAQRKWKAAKAQTTEAKAKQASDELTYQRMKEASIAYPGAVVRNELDVAEQTAASSKAHAVAAQQWEDAAEAEVTAAKKRAHAATNSAQSVRQMEAYLNIYAPFDGVITERNIDEGSFVSAPTGTGTTSTPMLRVQQISVLRLVVAVPESDTPGIIQGKTVKFTVPAFGKRTFDGTIKRIGHALDMKTRTMPVELDVQNADGELEPGMYPEVLWPTQKKQSSLFVPASAVVTNTEKRFVVRVKDGVIDWVDVETGATMDDLIEVDGALKPGESVAVKASDQLRPGSKVTTRLASKEESELKR